MLNRLQYHLSQNLLRRQLSHRNAYMITKVIIVKQLYRAGNHTPSDKTENQKPQSAISMQYMYNTPHIYHKIYDSSVM